MCAAYITLSCLARYGWALPKSAVHLFSSCQSKAGLSADGLPEPICLPLHPLLLVFNAPALLENPHLESLNVLGERRGGYFLAGHGHQHGFVVGLGGISWWLAVINLI